jgi:hypothetical protein
MRRRFARSRARTEPNLLAIRLQAMAEVQGVELVTLPNRYLGQGLEVDLDEMP